MKRKEQALQICNLTTEEKNDPHRVMREFTDDLSLSTVRNLVVTMRDICSTTENITYSDPKAREDLLYVTQKIVRFFEASYIQLGKITFQMHMNSEQIRQLKILEKPFFKNSKGAPYTVPCISLYGKWLASAGFKPGDLVTVAAEDQSIFITLSQEWDKMIGEAKVRA